MQRLALLGLVMLITSPVLAAEVSCDPMDNLVADDANPALYVVRDGVEKSFFQDNGASCPGTDPVCRENAYLIAGDFVVVTSAIDGFVCAAFTNDGTEKVTTIGWLPASEVEPVALPPAKLEDFAGSWAFGDEHLIRIAAAGGKLTVEGEATYGAHDPRRVASGGVNVGSLEAELVPDGNLAAWTEGDEGTEPWQPGDEGWVCRARLWALPPYLIAADNGECGGQYVTFTGVYAPTR